ncbi:MAG TPA: depupylase/deamidase Dop, partial [Nitrospiria bacterium]|nr:depupylase/deamidase Dop [Nitrospiria bacterium]
MTARIVGTETEFGISIRDSAETDPVAASILLVNSVKGTPAPAALWDYENENPLVDARGFEVEGEKERPTVDYNRLLNKLLGNGGRLYVDGAHPEYSTPECASIRDVVRYEKAGERLLESCRIAADSVGGDRRFVLYKNNTDGKGNSYGYHENYLVARSIPFALLVSRLVPFFVTRQIYAGAGKVGSENRGEPAEYQLSQRADFFETVVDLNTMVKRPIMNTRDEPHADKARYRRLHVIVGDANMSEAATYLKVGVTSLVLAMIEHGYLSKELNLANPVKAIKAVSRDLSLQQPLELEDGRRWTAIQIQEYYLNTAQRYCAERGADAETKDILSRWERVLRLLSTDPGQLVREVDWVIKRDLLRAYIDRKGCGWDDSRVRLMDLQYHDLRPEKGLFAALERGRYVERVVTDEAVTAALTTPPPDTRAYFRARCLEKFPQHVYAASWAS